MTELKPHWDGLEDEDHKCSRPGCDKTAWDECWPTLIYITVLTSPGEEGYAEVTQALCDEHAIETFEGLAKLGFVSHNHHGTNPMVPDECHIGQRGTCPLDTEYGPELVQHD